MRSDLQRLKRDGLSGRTAMPRSRTLSFAAAPATRIAKLWKIAIPVLLLALVLAGGFHYRMHRSPPLTDKDTIVIADFANNTGDAIFDDTLKTALNISLRQSPFLKVLPDSQVAKTLKLMMQPTDTKLTPALARELCQRAGSKAYIAGSIGSLGREYVLELKTVNCVSGDTLAEGQVTVDSKEKVLNTLGKAASELRAEMGESLATVQKFDVPLIEVTTPSLEALKAYSLGRRALTEKGEAAALPYHQRAIELDPTFAVAYRAVGADYYAMGEVGRASEYYIKAFQLREHTSEREKLFITTVYYGTVTGELDKALQTYEEEIQSFPRDPAYMGVGNMYSELGQYEKAAAAYRESVRFLPDSAIPYGNLAFSLLALQRFDEARQTIQQAQARKLDDFLLREALYAIAFVRGDVSSLSEQQQWFAGKPTFENYGLSLASNTEAYAGRAAKAWELTKQAVDSAVREDDKEGGAVYLTSAALQQAAYGNTAESRQSAAKALKLAPTSPGVESEAALAFAMAGNAARAESLAQDLRKRFPLDTQKQSLWLPAIQAQLALNQNSPAEAVHDLQAASPFEFGLIPFLINISPLYHVYLRGEAYLAAGQGNAAAAEFQKILDHSGIVGNCWTGALARLGVARANALQSRTSPGAEADAARVRALAAYKDFLTLWKDADPDIPILKEAKLEYESTQRERRHQQ